MENQNESLEFDIQNQGASVRPVFLTVIAILSWISVAWGVFGAVNQLTKSEVTLQKEAKAAIYEIKKSSQGGMEELVDQTKDFMLAGMESNTPQNYGYLFLFLLQGVAVFLMFQLKKIGFWTYFAIQVGILAVMIIYYPWPNMLSSVAVGYRVFTSLLFTILFAVNVKHMTK